MEGEYKLVPQFNYTQKDHGEQEDPSGVLKPEKKMCVAAQSLALKLHLRTGPEFSQKACLFFTYKYQAHFKLTSLDKTKLWQFRECKSSLRSYVNIYPGSKTGTALHCSITEPLAPLPLGLHTGREKK